jgi:hypothetical protein
VPRQLPFVQSLNVGLDLYRHSIAEFFDLLSSYLTQVHMRANILICQTRRYMYAKVTLPCGT